MYSRGRNNWMRPPLLTSKSLSSIRLLISLVSASSAYTRRKLAIQANSKSWHHALPTLKKLLNAQTPESWIPYQKEAYALRS